jgi:hypothetical protein
MLDENAALIQTVVEFQRSGKPLQALSYQKCLHKNMMYLAELADAQQQQKQANAQQQVSHILMMEMDFETVLLKYHVKRFKWWILKH